MRRDERVTLIFAIVIFVAFVLLLWIITAEGNEVSTPIDKEISQELVGVWKEWYAQGCIEGESLVIYYADKTYEEHATYIATERCELDDGRVLEAGEVIHDMRAGKWFVSYGYIHYVDTGDVVTSKLKVISIGSGKASYEWDNRETCKGSRIDL